jgi:adenylate cyclase
MAACLGQMEHREEAEKAAAAVLDKEPHFSIHSHVAPLPYTEAADREHLADGLRKAGLPE